MLKGLKGNTQKSIDNRDFTPVISKKNLNRYIMKSNNKTNSILTKGNL